MSKRLGADGKRGSADLEDTQVLDPVPDAIAPRGRIHGWMRSPVVLWSAAALAIGLVAGVGVTWKVASISADATDISAVTLADNTGEVTASDDAVASITPGVTVEALDDPDDALGTIMPGAGSKDDADATSNEDSVAASPSCTAVIKNTETWGNGFKLDIDVIAGPGGTNAWTVTLDLGKKAQPDAPWRAQLVSLTDGIAVYSNEGYNGSLEAGGTADFGFTGSGKLGKNVTASCSA